MDIYDRIQQLMKAKNVTAATVCKNTGISSALMTQWKQRKQNPSGIKLQKVADYFGVSVDFLLGKEVPTQTATSYELTEHEIEVLNAYRNMPDMQRAVDKILNVNSK